MIVGEAHLLTLPGADMDTAAVAQKEPSTRQWLAHTPIYSALTICGICLNREILVDLASLKQYYRHLKLQQSEF